MEIKNAVCLPVILVLNALTTHPHNYLSLEKLIYFCPPENSRFLRESMFNTSPCIRFMLNTFL